MIRRRWYASSTSNNPYINSNNNKLSADTTPSPIGKFAPDIMITEPGAVLCRVSKSFLRFGQLEIFAMRGELEELIQLADYACFREFPELLDIAALPTSTSTAIDGATPTATIRTAVNNAVNQVADITTPSTTDSSSSIGDDKSLAATIESGPPERYVQLFRCIAKCNAELVADWLRVGYVQGNMNSDNTLLAGRTIDYGPYGWMEQYDPYYQPFTSDSRGNFAFLRQPTAMSVNIGVLGKKRKLSNK